MRRTLTRVTSCSRLQLRSARHRRRRAGRSGNPLGLGLRRESHRRPRPRSETRARRSRRLLPRTGVRARSPPLSTGALGAARVRLSRARRPARAARARQSVCCAATRRSVRPMRRDERSTPPRVRAPPLGHARRGNDGVARPRSRSCLSEVRHRPITSRGRVMMSHRLAGDHDRSAPSAVAISSPDPLPAKPHPRAPRASRPCRRRPSPDACERGRGSWRRCPRDPGRVQVERGVHSEGLGICQLPSGCGTT